MLRESTQSLIHSVDLKVTLSVVWDDLILVNKPKIIQIVKKLFSLL